MKKGNLSTILLILVFLIGLSLMLYPTVSDYWNSFHQSRAIVNYQSVLDSMSVDDFTNEFETASEYNRKLLDIEYPLINYDRAAGYEDILNVSGNGIMGYISIPKIQVELPVYHGTSSAVLNVGVGHLQGTSLPVGGESTHSVLSAHRGLPSARLFTDLDEMVVGDTFTITVLNRVLTYEVDQIRIVEPVEVEELVVVEGEDYCTLMTCTPYGVNTHRMLVRGTRIETEEAPVAIHVPEDAVTVEPILIAPLIAVPLLLLLLIWLLVKYRKRKK